MTSCQHHPTSLRGLGCIATIAGGLGPRRQAAAYLPPSHRDVRAVPPSAQIKRVVSYHHLRRYFANGGELRPYAHPTDTYTTTIRTQRRYETNDVRTPLPPPSIKTHQAVPPSVHPKGCSMPTHRYNHHHSLKAATRSGCSTSYVDIANKPNGALRPGWGCIMTLATWRTLKASCCVPPTLS